MGLNPKDYLYVTVHRVENTDNQNNLRNICEAMAESGETIVFPIHPRTRKSVDSYQIPISKYQNIRLVDPVGYLDNLVLKGNAKKILTDSGGVQKQAFFLKVPCITLRSETEWVETVGDGWNILVGADKQTILSAIKGFESKKKQSNHFGDGQASEKIVQILSLQLK